MPRTFLRTCVRVRFQECDPLGHLNNTVYLGFLEQAAIDHAAVSGWSASRLREEFGSAFVARRHELDFIQPAYENDILEISTWLDSMSGARAARHYVIRKIQAQGLAIPESVLLPGSDLVIPERDDLVVKAVTEWAFVDLERGRPTRIPLAMLNDFREPER